eukprot:811471_1
MANVTPNADGSEMTASQRDCEIEVHEAGNKTNPGEDVHEPLLHRVSTLQRMKTFHHNILEKETTAYGNISHCHCGSLETLRFHTTLLLKIISVVHYKMLSLSTTLCDSTLPVCDIALHVIL